MWDITKTEIHPTQHIVLGSIDLSSIFLKKKIVSNKNKILVRKDIHVDVRSKNLNFGCRRHVFLKIAPMKGMFIFW